MGPKDKAEAILEAALELFVERGFHGTAMPVLADKAGVSAGTIYHYFESKEALVNVLYRKWKSAIAKMLFEGFPADKPPREQFRTAWRLMAEFALAHRREFAFLELHNHQSYLDAQSKAIEEAIQKGARARYGDIARLDRILEAERLGYDSVWTAEAYGSDAVTPAAWIAARTERIHVGTAIMQMPARTAASDDERMQRRTDRALQ